jgi:putative membrane protein
MRDLPADPKDSPSPKRPPGPEDPRVRYAAERTLLAWVRTGLALMGFGFVVARFGLFLRRLAAVRLAPREQSTGLSLWIGTTLVLLGVTVTLLAAGQHWRELRRLNRGEDYAPPRWSLGLLVAVILGTLGLVMAGYLVLVS